MQAAGFMTLSINNLIYLGDTEFPAASAMARRPPAGTGHMQLAFMSQR
jgi:hypothetical protein